MKKAFITGITGQDGSYLAELLLSKGYEVHGLIRRASTYNTARIDHIYVDPHNPNAKLYLHYGDLSETSQLTNLLYSLKPDEIYHLGAQSHVRVSFDIPEYTEDITGIGTVRILEAIRRGDLNSRFYQASSSEMYGSSSAPQSETTPFHPRSPYACAKLMSFWTTANYREGYNLFACNGILFNHESPRRGQNFLTRKVTRAIAMIKDGKQDCLYLGNLDACRDWGYAPEYVELMWKILQHEKPDDYVIGTGETHSVQEFVEEAFSYVGLDFEKYVKIDPKYYRPTEVENLQADPTKAKTELDWELKIKFKDLIKIMIDSDMRAEGLDPVGEGDKLLDKYYPNRWWKVD